MNAVHAQQYCLEEYMSEHSAFEKLHVDDRDKADLGGLLEQLNLPPVFVQYVRKHQKAIYIILAVITIAVVAWALYDSYTDKKIVESNSALAVALKLENEEKLQALQAVLEDFSGTEAAIWAKVEIGRYHVKKNEMDKALEQYSAVRNEISDDNPLTYLLTFGIAQAAEALNNYDKAIAEYDSLKQIKGYEGIAYNGTARIYEVQGNIERAVNEYEQYLGSLPGGLDSNPEKLYISEKITTLKAQQ